MVFKKIILFISRSFSISNVIILQRIPNYWAFADLWFTHKIDIITGDLVFLNVL